MAATFLSPILKDPGRRWRLVNSRSQDVLATNVETAFDRATRNRGLLGRSSMAPGSALILAPCSSIHTFFMQFAIDVVFVARDGRVRKIARALPAWRIRAALGAFAVVELAAGTLDRVPTDRGDVIQLTSE